MTDKSEENEGAEEPAAVHGSDPEAIDALVHSVQADPENAPRWATLYRILEVRIKSLARSRSLPGAHDPEDLVQEVITYVHRNLHTYQEQPGSHFTSWLTKITENKIKDMWRRATAQKREGGITFRDLLNSKLSDPGFAAKDPRASQIARANEILELQIVAMMQLSERHRTVLELRTAGLPYDEVAAKMGYEKASTVRALHNRAIERLRTLMDKVRESRG